MKTTASGIAQCLIVDDSEENLVTMTRLMKKFGFQAIIHARSGEEALDVLKESPDNFRWDLILMDISMPGMGGIEACRLIKQQEELKDIPIIVITGHAAEEFLEPALAVGVSDYLSRPIRKIELMARVRSSLRLKSAINMHRKTINDLKDTLQNLKTLKGLLPICANCKKIRDDSGYWEQVDSYISRHSDASFAEAICPDCREKNHHSHAETAENHPHLKNGNKKSSS